MQAWPGCQLPGEWGSPRHEGADVGSVNLSAHEVARLRCLVELAASAPPQPGMLATIMGELQELIGCDFVACLTIDAVARRTGHHEAIEAGDHSRATDEELEAAGGDDDPFFQRYWGSVCARPEGAGAPVTQAISQFRTVQQWRNDPMREVMEEDDPVIDEILLSYPTGPGRSRRVLIGRRGGRRFAERELLLATLLQPHLTQALRSATRLPTQPAASLTERQREILALVRVGLANKEIARSLDISPGTVRKHLENIYAELGVQSRTAAVAVAADAVM